MTTIRRYKQSETMSCLREYTACDDSEFLEGVVFTPYGIVKCYSQRDHSHLNFVHNGEFWEQVFDHGFTKRGLASKAHQFSKTVVQES